MKLSRTEINLLVGNQAAQKRRRRDAWISFVLVIGAFIGTYQFGLLPALHQSELLGAATGATTVYLVHVHFAIRPEDRLINLLQRYVNRDPEAVSQMAQTKETDGIAA